MTDLKNKIIDKSFNFEDDDGTFKSSTIFLKDLFEIPEIKQLLIHSVGWRSEQLPDFDVQEINEILKDCKDKQEDLQALICRIWNKGYMTAVSDEREG